MAMVSLVPMMAMMAMVSLVGRRPPRVAGGCRGCRPCARGGVGGTPPLCQGWSRGLVGLARGLGEEGELIMLLDYPVHWVVSGDQVIIEVLI